MKRTSQFSSQTDYTLSISDLMASILALFIIIFIGQMMTLNFEKGRISDERDSYQQIIHELEITKTDIVKSISQQIDVEIDVTSGDIRLDSEILFESNATELKSAGKDFLREFIPKYMNVLLGNEEVKSRLSHIIIEGHTDKKGGYLYNLRLSQNRALAVVNFIFSDEMPYFPEKISLQEYITANGRSYMDFLGAETDIDHEGSRRVEFKFKLKEDEVIKKLKEVITKE
jgi:chemotaxis protein MotB